MKTSFYLIDIDETDQFQHFDALPVGCVVLKDGIIVSANEFFAEAVGQTKIQLIGKSIIEYLLPQAPHSDLPDDLRFEDLLDSPEGSRRNIHLQLKSAHGIKTKVTVSVNPLKKPETEAKSKAKETKKQNGCLITIAPLLGHPSSENEQDKQMMLSSLLKLSDSYYVYFNLAYEVVYFNSKAQTMHNQVIGVDLRKGMHLQEVYGIEGLASREKDYYKKVLAQGELTNRIEYSDKNSQVRYVDITYKVMKNASGDVTGILEYGKDVTDLILANTKRKSSENILDLVLTNSTDSYLAYDLDLKVMFFNKIAEDRFKKTVNAKLEIGKPIYELVGNTKDYEQRIALYQSVMKTCEPVIREAIYEVDGESFYYQSKLSCLKDQDGKVIGILSCATDISELAQSQLELASRNFTLKAVLDSSRDGIAALDRDYNVLACNEQAIAEYDKFANVDLKSELSIGKQITPEEFSRWKNTIYEKVFAGETLNMVVNRESANEIYENIYTPVKDSQGEIIGALEISRDITEIENKRIELEKSEQRFKGLVDHIPAGLAKVNQDGKISYVSPRGAQIMGYKQDELLGKFVLDIIAKEEQKKMITDIQVLLSGKKKEKVNKYTIKQKDGKTKKIEGIASVSKAIDNELSFLLAFNDITEQHEIQVRLDETASNFVSLFMNMHDAVIIYNHTEEKYVNCNVAGLQLFNRSKEELLAGNRMDFVAEYSTLIPGVNLHDRMKANRVITAEGKKVVDSTTVLIDAQGLERLVTVNIVPKSKDEVYLIMKDITDAQRTEQLLLEKTSVYEALINNSFDGIDIVKYQAADGYFRDGELIMRNERMSRIIGGHDALFDSDESLLLISPEIQPNGQKSKEVAKKAILETIKEGKSLIEYRFDHKEGSYDVEASQKMVEIDDFVYMIKNYRDITDAVKQRGIIQEQIEALNAKNEEMKIYIESNLQLENFAYIASHDLKAPIRSVISFAQLLKNNAYDLLGPKNGRFLDIIITASTNMQVLIDDLLAYSRINTQEIEFENVDLPKLLKHLLIEINQTIAEKNGEVIIKNLPATLVGDASRLRQIFQNLITNGMKFHQEGEMPKVEIEGIEKRDHFKFTVKDFGIGIEEQYLREIFLMFKKLHSENKYKGTGIGLSICKKITEQHEGDIWVESTLGKGSTFHFTISKNLKTNI